MDPDGHRTIGVLTKCDIAQASEVVKACKNEGDTVKFKYGFHGVINRNKDQDARGMTISQSLVEEMKIFNDPSRGFVASPAGTLGIKNLSQTLSKLLGEAVKKAITRVQAHLKDEQEALAKKIEDYPEVLSEDKKKETLDEIICKFNNVY